MRVIKCHAHEPCCFMRSWNRPKCSKHGLYNAHDPRRDLGVEFVMPYVFMVYAVITQTTQYVKNELMNIVNFSEFDEKSSFGDLAPEVFFSVVALAHNFTWASKGIYDHPV